MFVYSDISAKLLFVETDYRIDKIRVLDGDEEVYCPVLSVREKQDKIQTVLDASLLTPWSVYEPKLYTIETEQECQRFGHTSLQTFQNKTVLLNECPIYLRGYIRGIVAHDHPNMTGGSDYDAAVKNIKQAKKYGFNLVRFHSTIPSEDFVKAADELGLLIHMEIGFAYETDESGNRKVTANNKAWTDVILRYRNHPSVTVFCIGNEMHNSGHFPEVEAMYREGKRLAPNKLIMDNSGWGEYDRTSADIFSQHIAYFFPYKHHAEMFVSDAPWALNGSVSDEPLNLETRTNGAAAVIHRQATPVRPVVSHEAVHYIDIPDYEALTKKFDAFAAAVGPEYLERNQIKKPRYMTELPELIRTKGLTDLMPDYVAASRAFKCSSLKVYMERLRLSPLCGYEMLQFSDCLKYENKNGIVDCFDDDKGIDPQWMNTFNGDLVLLADMNDEVFYEDQTVVVDIYASDYLPQPQNCGDLRIMLDQTCIYTGKSFVLAGGLQKLANLAITVPHTGVPHQSVLRAVWESKEVTVENSWKIWIYPRIRPVTCPATRLDNKELEAYLQQGQNSSDVVVTDKLDEQLFADLKENKTVILFYEYGAERNKWQLPGALERYKPCIWDRGNNLGGILKNEVLRKALAADKYFDLNLQPILEAGTKVNLDHFPCPVEEHILGADKPVRDRIQGLVHGRKSFIPDDSLRRFSHLFSLKIGQGTLIVCTLNISKLESPVVSNLLTALVDRTEIFATGVNTTEALLRNWIEEVNAAGFRREDVMNHFWELDNKPVEDTLFWEEYGIDLALL